VQPSSAYGADVRSLRPSGFTFVLLPAEGPDPPGDDLLPMLKPGNFMLFYRIVFCFVLVDCVLLVMKSVSFFSFSLRM
jgi:hypothetical protein